MNAVPWHGRIARYAALGLFGTICLIGSALAVPPTLNSSGLTPQQCYWKDSGCTRMCGDVTGNLRYECFGICDRMLDRCLSTGDWSDSREAERDPDSGRPPDRRGELSAFFMRMLMILGDEDGDGDLTPVEIQSLKEKVLQRPEMKDGSQAPAVPGKQ